jgi:hypothetical protein
MKKSIFFLVFLILAAEGFAQDFEPEYKNKITNLGFWGIPDRDLQFMSEIAVELGIWSAGIRYNWFLSDYFSVGARTFIHNNILVENKIWSFDFVPRLMSPTFLTPYVEFGIGYGDIGAYEIENGSLMISPGFGLNMMGLFLGLSVPMKFEPTFDYYFRVVFGFGMLLVEDLKELFRGPGKATPVAPTQ